MGRDGRAGEHRERSFVPANLRERFSPSKTFDVLKRAPKDQKKLAGMVIAVSCQSSCWPDGVSWEILVVANGYCAV